MVISILLVCLLGFFFFRYITKSWLNPGTVFFACWFLFVFLASLQLYDIAETSQMAYFIVLIGVISYFIGSFIGTYKFKILKRKRKNYIKEYYLNYNRLDFASIIVILYSIYRLITIIALLAGGNSWWSIRLMATSGEGGEGTVKGGIISDLLYSLVISPLVYLIAPVIITDFFIGKRSKKSIVLAIIAITLYSISTVSRSIWAFSIIYVIANIFIFKSYKEYSKRVKRMLIYVPVILLVIIFAIGRLTFLRNSESDLLTNAYAYMAGGLPLLSEHLETAMKAPMTLGFMSLFGFAYPIFFFLNYTGILKYPVLYLKAQEIKKGLEQFVQLGPTIWMNAYSTLFFYFYTDLGIAGVILGSVIFALINMRSFKNMQNNPSIHNTVIYLILLQFILFSGARIYTSLATRALSFVWILYMFKQKRVSEIGQTEELKN